MATERATSWAEPNGQETMENIAENALRAAHRRLHAHAAQIQAGLASALPALPWVAAGAASWIVFTSTQSWAQAAIAGACLFALWTLRAMHSAQRLEALALREQIGELRLSLRVTQALLDVEAIAEAEHLDDELDDARQSGTRRLPRQRKAPRKVG
jgi:hypothetical protein